MSLQGFKWKSMEPYGTMKQRQEANQKLCLLNPLQKKRRLWERVFLLCLQQVVGAN